MVVLFPPYRMTLSVIKETIYPTEYNSSDVEVDASDKFKVALLETSTAEIELKMKKGRGKLKQVDKEATHLDADFIMNQQLSSEPKSVRKILEDRRYYSNTFNL